MASGVWGRKIGMAQVFANDKVIPVTAIDVANWFVTNIKMQERDGYNAVQVGYLRKRYIDQEFSKGWLKSPKKYFRYLREILLKEEMPDLSPGKSVDFYSLITQGDKVDVFGKTKGCGFAGVVRRHNFAGSPGSHGHTMGDKPGSIGNMASCGKVIKGRKLPGHMGNKNRAMKNLEIVRVVEDSKMLLVKGSVPGKAGSLVFIRRI